MQLVTANQIINILSGAVEYFCRFSCADNPIRHKVSKIKSLPAGIQSKSALGYLLLSGNLRNIGLGRMQTFQRKKFQSHRKLAPNWVESQLFQGKKCQSHRKLAPNWAGSRLFREKSAKATGSLHRIGLNLSFSREKVPKPREACAE